MQGPNQRVFKRLAGGHLGEKSAFEFLILAGAAAFSGLDPAAA